MGYAKDYRPSVHRDQRAHPSDITKSTAASTALEPRGTYALVTAVTSSGTPVVYTLQAPVAGDVVEFFALDNVSSSQAPFHINAGGATAGAIAFAYATAGTAQDMVAISSQGGGFRARALNSSEWMCFGLSSAALPSTST